MIGGRASARILKRSGIRRDGRKEKGVDHRLDEEALAGDPCVVVQACERTDFTGLVGDVVHQAEVYRFGEGEDGEKTHDDERRENHVVPGSIRAPLFARARAQAYFDPYSELGCVERLRFFRHLVDGICYLDVLPQGWE